MLDKIVFRLDQYEKLIRLDPCGACGWHGAVCQIGAPR
jgi:hypothetical protein